MIKYIQKGLVVILLLILIIIIIDRIPLKKAIKIDDLKELSKSTNEYEILICIIPQSTGPNWAVVGNENGMFSESEKQELIIIDGNIPENKITRTLFTHSKNMFVIRGKTVGEKEYLDQGEKFRVFNVEDWYLVKPIDRSMSLRLFAPKGYLSLFDYN